MWKQLGKAASKHYSHVLLTIFKHSGLNLNDAQYSHLSRSFYVLSGIQANLAAFLATGVCGSLITFTFNFNVLMFQINWSRWEYPENISFSKMVDDAEDLFVIDKKGAEE